MPANKKKTYKDLISHLSEDYKRVSKGNSRPNIFTFLKKLILLKIIDKQVIIKVIILKELHMTLMILQGQPLNKQVFIIIIVV